MKFAKRSFILPIALFVVLTLVPALPAQTQNLIVLHNFTGTPDGAGPHGPLLFDQAGNLYGTTGDGGAGFGTVFKLDPSGNESVLYSFAGAPDGAFPSAGLVRDTAGNLYGTTTAGGNVATCLFPFGCGTVFKLDPGGTETVLYRFGSNSSDGTRPSGPLTLDSAGNLFGTTFTGGWFYFRATDGCQRYIGANLVQVGCGTVFKLDANGEESILRALEVGDGAFPSAGLVQDAAGNLYGTAYQGGLQNCMFSLLGCGTVFKVDPALKVGFADQFSVLYSFQGPEAGPDGAYPEAGLVLDLTGNLYGTTTAGGSATGCPSLAQGENCGTIFQLTPAGKETVIHSFKGGLGTAGGPTAGLVRDAAGNFYGLAGGTIFKLDSNGKESDLYTFTGADAEVSEDLVQDANGNLYGTTLFGANGFGTVFKLTTSPDFAVSAFTLTPATLSPGSSASSTLELTAVSGFTDTVTFACSVSPKPVLAPECSVSPASTTPGTPVTVTVTTTGPSAHVSASSPSGTGLCFAVWLPLLGMVGIGKQLGSRQRKVKAMLLGCALLGGVVLQVACGNSSSSGGGSSGTPAGAYTITVTGTSSAATGSLVRSTATTLQVQ
jgi:uncharacterized repeat protein (TIGR03803 family)